MKGKYYISSVLFILFLTLSLSTGCKKSSSNNNNNPVGPTPSTNSLVGTWALTKVTITGQNNAQTSYTPQQMGIGIVWVFRNDNSASVTIEDSTGQSTDNGTYSFANNTLTLKDAAGETRTFPLTFVSNSVFNMQLVLPIQGVDTNSLMEFTKQAGINEY